MWEIAAKTIPFAEFNNAQFIKKLMNGERETIPTTTPSKLREIITSCWHEVPEQRNSLASILNKLEEFNTHIEQPTY